MSGRGQSDSFISRDLLEELFGTFVNIIMDVVMLAFFIIALLIYLLATSLLLSLVAFVIFVLSVAYDPAFGFAIWMLSMTPLLASALVGLSSVSWLYPTEDGDGGVSVAAMGNGMMYPGLVLIVPVVLLVGFYLRTLGAFLTLLGGTIFGNLILFVTLHRAASYGIVVSLRNWDLERENSKGATFQFPGFVTFLGFSWLAGATQYKAFSMVTSWVGSDWEGQLHGVVDSIPGLAPTPAVGAAVPLFLAGSIVPYVWLRRMQWRGQLEKRIDYAAEAIKTVAYFFVRTLVVSTSVLYRILRYVTLVPPRGGAESGSDD